MTLIKKKYEKEYMEPYDFKKNSTTSLIIKANTGMGKTKELKKLCKKYKKVIIVTFRVTLGEQFLEKFNDFHFYQHSSGVLDTNIYNKIIVQIDSLWRVQGECDLIVMDECQYNFIQLVQSKKREQSFIALLTYIKNSEYFIAIDALFNEYMVDYVYQIRPDSVFIENIYKLHINKKVINYNNNLGVFEKQILENIKNGKNIVICTNSKKFLTAIEYLINTLFNKIKTFFYDGIRDYTLNLEEWDSSVVVGYTPTIVAGISYENKHFDKVFGYFINESAPAEMSIQQLFRVRNLNENEYHICMDIKSDGKYPLDLQDIENSIIKRNTKLALYSDTIKIDNFYQTIVKDDYFKLYINYIKLINTSKNGYEKHLLELLSSQGMVIENISIPKDIKEINKESRKNLNDIKKIIENKESENICNESELNEDEYKIIEQKYKKTQKEYYQCKKYNFRKKFKYNKELNIDTYNKYKNLYKEFYNLCLMYTIKDEFYIKIEEKIKFQLDKYNNNNFKILHRNFNNEKLLICNNLIRILGLNNIFDKREIEINFDKLYNYLKINWDDIFVIWDLKKGFFERFDKENKQLFTQLLRFINTILNKLFKIKIIKNKNTNKYYISGLEIWDDDFTFNNNEIIQDIINKHKEDDENYNLNQLIKNIINYE